MPEPGVQPWDRRDGEPASHYQRFLEYANLPPSERPKWLAAHSKWRAWCTADEWRLRAAQRDDQADVAHQQWLAEAKHDFQVRHAKIGRSITAMVVAAIAKLDLTNVRLDALTKLLTEARKSEQAALFGSEREAQAAMRSALVAAGVDEPLTDWDVLARKMDATLPPELRQWP